MKIWLDSKSKKESRYMIKENGRYYMVIFDNIDGYVSCDCGGLFCDHIKEAMKLRQEE